MSFGGFPKALSYAISKLENFSKQTVKLYSDRLSSQINPGDILRVKLPVNSLNDLRTFQFFYSGVGAVFANTTTNVYTQGANFPRNSASVIDNLAIYMNGVQIENIPAYNLLFNTIWDLTGGGAETQGKRSLENVDPSLKYRLLQTGANTLTPVVNALGGATTVNTNDGYEGSTTVVGTKYMVSNWLGFLGSSSTEIIDTADIPEIWIELRLAPSTIMWKQSIQNGTQAASLVPSYYIFNTYFTISRCSFYDPLYYEIKSAALQQGGLEIAYNTYNTYRGPRSTKDINMQIQVNARSLNMLIGVPLYDAYQTLDYLLLTTANSTAAAGAKSLNVVLATAPAVNDTMFNTSAYFQRDGGGILTSQFEVNNVPCTPWALTPEEVFSEALIAFNMSHDTVSGCHIGLNSIAAFQKYYFCHITSFDFRQSSSDYLMCGIDGRQASINVKWSCAKDPSNTTQCYPIIFASRDEVINILPGGQVQLK